ncbi:MAG: type II toxin-antitoxin system RelE/ParE family toxin [Pseudomonadota bacterium]
MSCVACHVTNTLETRRIQHRGLRRLFSDDDGSRLTVEWVPRLRRQLAQLDAAGAPGDMDIIGWGFHALRGNRRGQYALRVSGNWRLVFRWDDDGPCDVDLEDYHGR